MKTVLNEQEYGAARSGNASAVRALLWVLMSVLVSEVGLAGSLTDGSGEPSVNLIRNHGFEEFDAAGSPVAWHWYNNMCARPSALTYFEVDRRTFAVLPVFKGGATGKVVNGGDVCGGFSQEHIAVEGHTPYQFEMKHIETEDFDRNLYICIRQYNRAGKDITGGTYYFVTDLSPTRFWRKFSRPFRTKPETVALALVISPNGKGTAWFDDISLRKVQENGN